MCSAGEAPERVPSRAERERGMMIVMKRAERLVPHDLHPEPLGDLLNREVAELLKFESIHCLSDIPRSWCRVPSAPSR